MLLNEVPIFVVGFTHFLLSCFYPSYHQLNFTKLELVFKSKLARI